MELTRRVLLGAVLTAAAVRTGYDARMVPRIGSGTSPIRLDQ